jgi:hypothetical protein
LNLVILGRDFLLDHFHDKNLFVFAQEFSLLQLELTVPLQVMRFGIDKTNLRIAPCDLLFNAVIINFRPFLFARG